MLGTVLGACLDELSGLNAVYIPSGVDIAIAKDLVDRANSGRPGVEPYAILIVPSDEPGGMSTNEALKYRQGNRLAVVAGRHPDLGSFTQSFKEILGLNYPEAAQGSVSLEAVALSAVGILLDWAGVEAGNEWNPNQAAIFLASALQRIQGLQKELREGTDSWNVYWFHQTDVGLKRLAEMLVTERPQTSELDDFFASYTFAAFGMSRPQSGHTSTYKPKQIADAMKNYWSDQASIVSSAGYLAHAMNSSEVDSHPIQTVDWGNFDREFAATDNHGIAFARYFRHDPSVTRSLADLTDPQFINPTSSVKNPERLKPYTVNGASMSIADPEGDRGPYLATATRSEWDDLVTTEEILVFIPTLAPVLQADLLATELQLVCNKSKADWHGELEVQDDGSLWCRGRITKAMGKYPWPVEPKSHRINVDLSMADVLMGRVDRSASCEIYIALPEITGLWTVPMRSGGALGKPVYAGVQEIPQPDWFADVENQQVELDPGNKKHRFVVWNSSGQVPRFEGATFDPLSSREGIFSLDAAAVRMAEIQVGDQTFVCRSPESADAPHSPVVAAIGKMLPSTDPLDATTMKSLRATYEEWLVNELAGPVVAQSFGHIIVPDDRDMDVLPAVVDSSSNLTMSEGLSEHWGMVSDFDLPTELIESEAAEEFRAALKNLNLQERFFADSMDEASSTASILSTTSWKDLWANPAPLERYLNAYSDLILEAKRLESSVGVFWATYPFSISVWSTFNNAKCRAVLLSPLHPIRLAWLAGVEHTLWHSELAAQLAGTVEGWNLPLVGPRETEMGRLMAVPMETGTDQVFLGWSMLVQVSIAEYEPLGSPENAGNVKVPGTAVSGLNATAVSAAMRSYRQMNPHISTLTVDLAASAPGTRLAEVDEAVLSEVGLWAGNSSSPLFGGARIWDSINRGGEPPREKVARLVQATADVPLTWNRYSPKEREAMRCNIRILQDGGVNVQLRDAGQSPRLGILPEVPLRRYEAVVAQATKNGTAKSSPTLRDNQGWEPLVRAVGECEGSASTTEVTTKLFATQLASASADWTVSGEALMNPSAMAAIVQKTGQGNQMLWEWRPPFLDSSNDVPALERRPFVSVARVPRGFKRQLERLLSKATGKPEGEELVSSLLGRLGTRGVGLSSMLSMGGTHAAGALGFYLVFSMMDHVKQVDPGTYVLPIDACDTFLRALAGNHDKADSKRRADVLILRIEQDELTFSPVEIKFYGLDSEAPVGKLPQGEEVSVLAEPLDQVQTTSELLTALQASWAEQLRTGNASDRALWTNGLAALVESAIRLGPSETDDSVGLAKAMENIAAGKSSILIGRPIVAYFKHEAFTSEGQKYMVGSVADGPLADRHGPFGLMSANSAAAFESIGNSDSSLVKEWAKLVSWSLQNTVGLEATVEGEHGSRVPASTRHEGPEQPEKIQDETTEPAIQPSPEPSIGDGKVEDEPEPEIIRQPFATVETDLVSVSEGVKFPVGSLLPGAEREAAYFWPSNTELNQMNVGIVGDLGTGKTQLMKALIFQLRRQSQRAQETPVSMLIFDYKRDFQDLEFLASVGGEVLRIDNIRLNFFQLREGFTPMAATQRANEFIDVLDKIYGGIGPVQKDRLQVTITDLYRENKQAAPTIGKVLERYSDGGERVDAVTSLLRKFVTSEVFTENAEEFQTFDDLMQNKVVVVALNDFGTDDDGKNALVVLFLNLYYDYMLNAQKWPYVGEAPQLRRLNSFLLVDEAVNIMKYKFPVLMNLLLQGREFGCGVMLASQYLSHFRQGQEDYAQPLLTWFIHKVPSVTSKDLSMLGLGEKNDYFAQRITSLQRHQSLYKSLGYGGKFIEDIPFFKLRQDNEGQV